MLDCSAEPVRAGSGSVPRASAKAAAAATDELAVARGEFAVGFDEMEHGLADVFARDGIVKDCGAVSGGDGGDDACGVGGADGLGCFAGGDGEGELIDVWCVVVAIGELKEDDDGVEAGEFGGVEDG